MANAIKIEVEGLKELRMKMEQLGPKLAKRGLRSAANAGIQVIKKEAKALAPMDTGRLKKKAIYVKRSKSESSPTKEVYILGVRVGRKEQKKERDAYYWFFHEFGTRFIAARPFIRPAFETKKYEALEKFKQKLKEKLDLLILQK